LIDDALCVSLLGAVVPGSHCVGVCGLEGVGTVDRLVGGDLPHHHALNFSVALRHYMRRALSLLNTDGIYLCGVCVRSPHVVKSVGQADGRTDGTSSIRRYGDKVDSIDRVWYISSWLDSNPIIRILFRRTALDRTTTITRHAWMYRRFAKL
jgi:hypothetical protein